MPHIGQAEGIWYAIGYNFAGVPMGSYLGRKIAEKILGLPAGRTAFDIAPFPTQALYGGNPWFVPLAMRWFAGGIAGWQRQGALDASTGLA
jgi:hypothetical protein